MPRLMTQFERARNLISQPPDKRMEPEIIQLVPWLRSKAKLFGQVKSEALADIMRNCMIETKDYDDIIIKQGDTGECFYIVLSGKVSIYILNKDELEGMEDDGIFDNIIQYTDKGKLDREKLGYMVTHLGTGATFGEVALISDSARTASIIAEERTDLLVVDRKLYNRSIKEVVAKEFQEKTSFIAKNPLFGIWAPKYRKQLAMAMYKESFGYESLLVRQGDRTTEMFFILSGQVEIQVDPSMHPHQYPRIFKAARENEVEKLIKTAASQRQGKHSKGGKKGTNGPSGGGLEPHQPAHGNQQIKRRDTSKCTRLCQLGVNESVGDAELTLDLPTYLQSAVCTQTTEVLVLEHRHYVRLFTRRHPRTIDRMREEIGVKLDSRLSLLSLKKEIPFLQYIRQIIASQNQPAPSADPEQDEHTVYTAEKEFLNHKGPLIDLYGPGSVFFLINLREKTKMRLRAKRGGPSDRQMFMNQSNSLPSSILMAAANQMKTLPPPPPSPRATSPRPSSSLHITSSSSSAPSLSSSTSSPVHTSLTASGSDASGNHGKPRSFRDMALLTQFVQATKQQQEQATGRSSSSNINNSNSSGSHEADAGEHALIHGRSGSSRADVTGAENDGDAQEMVFVHEEDEEYELRRTGGDGLGGHSPPELDEQRPVTENGKDYMQYPEGPDYLTHHHHNHQPQQNVNHQQPQRQHQQHRLISPSRSPEQISPRPTTGWLSSLTSVHGSLQENAEVNEATLSTLEARLRLFLETDNPRCRPQVAPLRRLALEDMEVQPKPGNKVVVRRRDPFKAMTPASGVMSEAPVHVVARILSRPRLAENGSSPRLSHREKPFL